jgi:hypothetical protein
VKIGSALFTGTLVFVRMIHHLPNHTRFGVRTADIQTAIQYAQRAAVPIQRYASQYGSSSIAVSPTMLSLSVTLTGNTFDDGDVQGWVDRIVSSHGLKDVCVVLLHDSFMLQRSALLLDGAAGARGEAVIQLREADPPGRGFGREAQGAGSAPDEAPAQAALRTDAASRRKHSWVAGSDARREANADPVGGRRDFTSALCAAVAW